MAKRSSLFGIPPSPSDALDMASPVPMTGPGDERPTSAPPESGAEKPRRYPIAKTREGKRVATVYLEREALRQLQKIAFDEETTLQALLTEGVNAVFAARGLSRIA